MFNVNNINNNNINNNGVHKAMVYRSLFEAQQQLADIIAIDFYLAKQLVCSIEQYLYEHQHKPLVAKDHSLLTHLFMYLSVSVRQGHSCLPLPEVANKLWAKQSDEYGVITHQGYQFPSAEQLTATLEKLSLSAAHKQPIVYCYNSIYLRRYFTFEQELAGYIKDKLQLAKNYNGLAIQQCLRQLFNDDAFTATNKKQLDWQMLSVANALNKKFTVVAGGPGTGKTYTVTKILAAIIMQAQQEQKSQQEQKQEQAQQEKKQKEKTQQEKTRYSENEHTSSHSPLSITLIAPTGKAAQRLSESITNAVKQFKGVISDNVLENIPTQASTIHRFLGVVPHKIEFRHNQTNKSPTDVLLIDEASMVDLALLTRVFRALKPSCQVILLGDADQLPSVQTGSVLHELVPRPMHGYSEENINYLQQVTQLGSAKVLASYQSNNEKFTDHLTILTQSRRFDGEGGIGKLAQAVIDGKSDESWQLLLNSIKSSTAQLFLNADPQDFTWLKHLVKQYYLPLFQCAEVRDAFHYFHQFRVLCATRQGNAGVEQLNQQIIHLLKDLGAKASIDDYYHSQPILILENDYQLGLYNGDIGFIWQDEYGHLLALFENEQGEYNSFLLSQLPKFETVYAMTIHKTQGSEFDHVAMILPEQSDHQLLSRELLYTGITRAKKQLTITAKKNVWQPAVQQKVQRYANLATAIRTLSYEFLNLKRT